MRAPFLVITSLLVLAGLLCAEGARAGRALEEPPGLAKLLRRAPPAELDAALRSSLADVAAVERCKASLKAPVAADPSALACRGVAAAAWAHGRPLKTKADVDTRAALLDDLVIAAVQVSTWAPLSPPPGLARARFDAHQSLSRAAMTLLDDLNAAATNGADGPTLAAAAQALARPPLAKDGACTTAQRSLDLGVGADATLEERGALQALITSHQCFLDERRLRVEPKPGLALKDSADAASVAAATSSSGAILAYAQSRSLDLERCEKHLDAGGRPKDAAKLEQCACGAVARWKLPHAKAATTTNVPVVRDTHVTLEVGPTGAVTRCALAPRPTDGR